MAHQRAGKKISSDVKQNIIMFGGLVFCIIFFSIFTSLHGQSIWNPEKLSTLISDVIVTALLSVGAVFVYALGNIDISTGKQVGLYATLMVVIQQQTGSLLWGVLLSFLIAIFIAIVNAITGELLHIYAIIPSVVFMFVLSGLSTIIYSNLGCRSISLYNYDYSIFKNPWVMVGTLIIESLLVAFVFNKTMVGKYTKAIGANAISASQGGANIIKYKVMAYIVMGVCTVVASLFQMGYTASASDSTGTGYELNVMIALILGGMPLSGGMKSRVSSALVGAMTFSLLNVGLPLIGVPVNFTFMVKALIFMIVVLITCRKRGGVLPH